MIRWMGVGEARGNFRKTKRAWTRIVVPSSHDGCKIQVVMKGDGDGLEERMARRTRRGSFLNLSSNFKLSDYNRQ